MTVQQESTVSTTSSLYSWLHCTAPSLTALTISHLGFQGSVRSELSAFFSLFSPHQVPHSHQVTAGSSNTSEQLRKHTRRAQLLPSSPNLSFKSCTTGHLQLSPCLNVLVSSGIDNTHTHTRWNWAWTSLLPTHNSNTCKVNKGLEKHHRIVLQQGTLKTKGC